MWILLFSIIMGSLYGFVFGLMDIEDYYMTKLEIKLIQEEYYCIPIAAILGFLCGVLNEFLRVKGTYTPFTI